MNSSNSIAENSVALTGSDTSTTGKRKRTPSPAAPQASNIAASGVSQQGPLPQQQQQNHPTATATSLAELERAYANGRIENGNKVFFKRSFVEDPWRHLV